MSLESNRRRTLQARAALFAALRHFFKERSILEVDCPLITQAASIDTHIDLMEVLASETEQRFLITSPEYGMKRLLSEGIGDIYQMSHVFRKEEVGKRHNPEFTLIEWYRLGLSFETFIEETCDLIQIATGQQPIERLPYHEAFIRFAGIDPLTASIESLRAQCPTAPQDWQRETLIDYIWSFTVEPHLGQKGLTVIHDYPAYQAALARTRIKNGREVAERFEVYYRSIELANGYHELLDAQMQRERLNAANAQRKELGKREYPLDEAFLTALEKGLPECCGVAVGFDRLLMIQLGETNLQSLLPFGWESA